MDDAIKSDDACITNLIAVLKIACTVKAASKIDMSVPNKKRPIKVVMSSEKERDKIL